MSLSSEQTMTAIVMTPERVEWQGAIIAVESENSEGLFSIMPDHTRFITLLEDVPIHFLLPDESTKDFHFTTSVLVVDDNTVTVYVHMEETVSRE